MRPLTAIALSLLIFGHLPRLLVWAVSSVNWKQHPSRGLPAKFVATHDCLWLSSSPSRTERTGGQRLTPRTPGHQGLIESPCPDAAIGQGQQGRASRGGADTSASRRCSVFDPCFLKILLLSLSSPLQIPSEHSDLWPMSKANPRKGQWPSCPSCWAASPPSHQQVTRASRHSRATQGQTRVHEVGGTP